MQYSTRVRNAIVNSIETTIGTAPTLEIRTGAAPASPASADSGTLLYSVTLPSDWMAAASEGVKEKLGTWSGEISTSGDAGHFRIKVGGACDCQGTVSQRESSGGTGDMKLARETVALVAGDTLSVDSFTFTAGGA
jgi:hypothetical protein